MVDGVQYQGDGYTQCKAVGPVRCAMNNGGCWSQEKHGKAFSACAGSELSGCKCPEGFSGDGLHCEDVDECREKKACSCAHCSCSNTWGGYDSSCKGDLVYIKGQDTCIGKNASGVAGWVVVAVGVLACLVGAGVAAYLFYKHRLRRYMDSEVMAIMSQYMPLDSQSGENRPLREEAVQA